MGLVSGIIRLTYLKQSQLDLEYKLQTLTQSKTQLASQSYEIVSIGNDLDPESPEVKHLEMRRERLNLMEKKIDLEISRTQNMLKMVEAEVESSQKIVDNSIKRSFSL